MATCVTTAIGRRKLFWATQPDAAGEDALCGANCGRPGLTLDGSSLSTENWIRGLAINMLMTDGREPNTECGYTPGAQGGHWSESYMSVMATVGTLVRTVKPAGRTQELTALVKGYVEATLARLVTRGVASSIEVEVKYQGSGRFLVDAQIIGTSGEVSKVGISGQRLANGWVWES